MVGGGWGGVHFFFISLCVYCDKMRCMCMYKNRKGTTETQYSPNAQNGRVSRTIYYK